MEELGMSGEELARRPDLNPCELIAGRIVLRQPASLLHGQIVARLGVRLGAWAEQTLCGDVLVGGVGVYTGWNPDTVRAADVLFISCERRRRQEASTFLDVQPELIIEIVSPEDLWTEVMIKLADYFSIGVDLVWVVDSKQRQVFAYRSLTDITQFLEGDVLTDPDILPGFSLPVADLFRD